MRRANDIAKGALLQTLVACGAILPGAIPCAAQTPPDNTSPETQPIHLSIDPAVQAPPALRDGHDLNSLSIEDLMNIEVTSVSRRRQRLADTPAPVSVISHEDIHRLQYQSFPELLRTIPGIYVGQMDGTHWAVGSRGGANPFTLNLLVMMDGRSIYNENTAGVFWRTVDYVLPDIERIEVVRGPGATLWGANAVNGVINIITKDAKDTQGLLVDGYAGTDGYINSVRYGGKIGDLGYFRVYGKSRDMGALDVPDGTSRHDEQDSVRTGFRTDLHLSPDDLLTIEGDIFRERYGAIVSRAIPAIPFSIPSPEKRTASGGNVLMRWTHTISDDSDFSLQFYYSNLTDVLWEISGTGQSSNVYDLDFQHRFPLADRQEIIWGAGYRWEGDFNQSIPEQVVWTPEHRVLQIANVFVQDDITLVPDRLHVIAGTKIEYDSIVETVEAQPSVRALWTPDKKNTFWAGVSRAARTPSIFHLNADLTAARYPGEGGVPTNFILGKNPNLGSEHLMAYEAGYRVEPTTDLSLDFTGFYYAYDHSYEYVLQEPVFQNGQLLLTQAFQDDQNGQNWGFEAAAKWNPTDRLTFNGSYSFLSMARFGGANVPFLQTDPQNQVKLGINYEIIENLNVNTQFYWIDRIPASQVDSFFRWDVGIQWQICKNAELGAGILNITDNGHLEQNGFGNSGGSAEIPRTLFVQLQTKF